MSSRVDLISTGSGKLNLNSRQSQDESAVGDSENEANDEANPLPLWLSSSPVWVPDPYEVHLSSGETRTYNLSDHQKLYLVLDDPRSWYA